MQETVSSERRLERVVKGFANHRRIQILRLLEKRPELSLLEVCKHFGITVKTGSEHVRKLALAGLVLKRNQGRWVRHRLSPLGTDILAFLRTLD
jgi:DNA-binding transcriptional ArsR family regulator